MLEVERGEERDRRLRRRKGEQVCRFARERALSMSISAPSADPLTDFAESVSFIAKRLRSLLRHLNRILYFGRSSCTLQKVYDADRLDKLVHQFRSGIISDKL